MTGPCDKQTAGLSSSTEPSTVSWNNFQVLFSTTYRQQVLLYEVHS